MNTKDPLEKQIGERRREIASERLSMSVGELTTMYKDDELIVHPEFQRFFRWDAEQKSRLVESILLGIPLPPIFVATTESGAWELVDGLQRISTLLEVQGLLVGADGKQKPALELTGTKFLPAMEGKLWAEGTDHSLSDAQRRDIKRARIDVQIIKRESSSSAKYDLFQRLNSYGSQLTAQELRSCLLVSVQPEFLKWVEGLAKYPSFGSAVQLSERLKEEQYDIELVLRFLTLHDRQPITQRELRGFSARLDDWSIGLAERHPRDAQKLERTFKTTFDIIADSGGEDVFRKWDTSEDKFVGSFLNTSFEVFGMGLGYHVARGERGSDIDSAVKTFWKQPGMQQNFATGLSTEVRMARYMPQGRELLAP